MIKVKTNQDIQRPDVPDSGQAEKSAAGLNYVGVITSLPFQNLANVEANYTVKFL